MPRHGHVTPNPDGSRARCGGPRICEVCQQEKAQLGAAPPVQVFNQQTLRQEIVRVWGPAGAHLEVFDAILSSLRDATAQKDWDECQMCLGWSGGAPGNENIIDGVIVCDYCTAKLRRFKAHANRKEDAHG